MYGKLESALFAWFLKQRELNNRVSTQMLLIQAKKFAPHFNIPTSFKFSDTWCFKFKKRFGIRRLKICGEKLSADIQAVKTFKDDFLIFVKDNDLTVDQIYNCDESGLFFKMLPRETLVDARETSVSGNKVDKNRITFMPCANLSGTNKLKLMVIGRSKSPRCFKNVHHPVYYRGSPNAWMDRKLFSEWFHDCFVNDVRRFSKKNKLPPKAVLLLDNCSAHHCGGDTLSSDDGMISAFFLPPNVTSIAQPMDQGVIQNIKTNYRKKLELTLMTSNDSLTNAIRQITLKDVVFWLHESWESVLPNTIEKSWKQIGLVHNGRLVDEDDVPLAFLFNVPRAETEEFLEEIEEERICHKHYSDSQIVNMVLGQSMVESDGSDDEEWVDVDMEENYTEIQRMIISVEGNVHTQAIKSLDNVLSWAEQCDLDLADILYLRKIRETAMKKSLQK